MAAAAAAEHCCCCRHCVVCCNHPSCFGIITQGTRLPQASKAMLSGVDGLGALTILGMSDSHFLFERDGVVCLCQSRDVRESYARRVGHMAVFSCLGRAPSARSRCFWVRLYRTGTRKGIIVRQRTGKLFYVHDIVSHVDCGAMEHNCWQVFIRCGYMLATAPCRPE